MSEAPRITTKSSSQEQPFFPNSLETSAIYTLNKGNSGLSINGNSKRPSSKSILKIDVPFISKTKINTIRELSNSKLSSNLRKIEEEMRIELEVTSVFELDDSQKFYCRKQSGMLTENNKLNRSSADDANLNKILNTDQSSSATLNEAKKSAKFSCIKVMYELNCSEDES